MSLCLQITARLCLKLRFLVAITPEGTRHLFVSSYHSYGQRKKAKRPVGLDNLRRRPRRAYVQQASNVSMAFDCSRGMRLESFVSRRYLHSQRKEYGNMYVGEDCNEQIDGGSETYVSHARCKLGAKTSSPCSRSLHIHDQTSLPAKVRALRRLQRFPPTPRRKLKLESNFRLEKK